MVHVLVHQEHVVSFVSCFISNLVEFAEVNIGSHHGEIFIDVCA